MVSWTVKKRRNKYKKVLIFLCVVGVVLLMIYSYPVPDFETETLLYPVQ